MKVAKRIARHWLALMIGATLLPALAGCGGNAFESNDFVMTWITTRPADEVIESTSGRTGDRDVDGILSAAQAVEDMRLADIRQEQAREYVRLGEPDKAAERLDAAIKLRPEDARYRRDRALLAIQQGDTKVALEHWDAQDRIARQNNWDLDPTYWMDAELDAGTEQERLEAEPPSPGRDAELAATYTRLASIYQRWAGARERGGALWDERGLEEMTAIAADYRDKAAELAP